MKSIKAKLSLVGVVGLSVVVVLGGLGVFGIRSGVNALESVYEQRVEPMRQVQEIDRDLKEIRFRIAGVMLGQLPSVGSRNHLKEARKAINENWAAFKSIAGDGGEEATAKLIARIDKQMAALPAFLDRLNNAYESDDGKKLAPLLEDEWPVFHAGLVKPLGELLPLQQAAAKHTYDESRRAGTRLISIGIGVAAVVGATMAAVLLLMARGINSGVSAMRISLAEVSGGNLAVRTAVDRHDEFGDMARSLNATVAKLAEVTTGVRDLADRVAAAANGVSGRMGEVIGRGKARNDAIMRVGAAAEEISVTSAAVAEFAANTEIVARRNETSAVAGSGDMGKNLDVMREVVGVVRESAESVSRLNDSIHEIGQISVTIKEIAEQTNLLALNAAIEAARAGESGRGFAVVADEVRKLAERTAKSTSEIAGVIETIREKTDAVVTTMEDIRQRVEAGSRYSHSTGEVLSGIVSGAQEATGQVRQIADNVREQSAATGEVSRQIAEITALTEQNAVSIRGAADAADEVSTIAGRLREMVGYFRV